MTDENSTGNRDPSLRRPLSSPCALPVSRRCSTTAASRGSEVSMRPSRPAAMISSRVRSKIWQAAGLASRIAPSGSLHDAVHTVFEQESVQDITAIRRIVYRLSGRVGWHRFLVSVRDMPRRPGDASVRTGKLCNCTKDPVGGQRTSGCV